MSTSDLTFDDDQEEPTDVLGYVFKYLRYWYWIVLSLIISFIVAYVYLAKFTPVYQVNATLLIKDEKKMNAEILEKLDMGSQSKMVENEIEVLKSRALIGKVVDVLNLKISYWEEGRARDKELYEKSPITLDATEITDYAYGHPLFIKLEPGKRYQLLDDDQTSLGTFDYNQQVKTVRRQVKVDK